MAAQAQPAEIGGSLPEDHFPALKPILLAALQKSPRTLEREIEIALQEARTLGTNASRLPRLAGDFSYANEQRAVSGNTSTQNRDSGLFYRVELSQALFHWWALKNDSARAQLAVAVAEKNFAEAYRLVLLTLRQTYLDLVTSKASLQQQRHRQRMRTAALALEEEKLASGLVSPGYVEGQKLSAREHALEVERAEVLFAAARRVFARAAGIPELPEADVPDSIPRPTHSAAATSAALAALLRDGGRSTFEAQVYELQVREAELSYKIARVRLLPKFNATAGYYLDNTTNATAFAVMQQGVERQAVSINAQWWIFDGFAARGAKREALAAKRLNERRLATVAEEALERAQTLGRLLPIEAAAMEMADIRSAIAAESLRQQREELELGNVSTATIEEATAQLHLSEAKKAAARANYLRAWSEFVSLAGMDPILNTLPGRYVRENR